jgi:hypothetical protein
MYLSFRHCRQERYLSAVYFYNKISGAEVNLAQIWAPSFEVTHDTDISVGFSVKLSIKEIDAGPRGSILLQPDVPELF